jgi:hypothetical protein
MDAGPADAGTSVAVPVPPGGSIPPTNGVHAQLAHQTTNDAKIAKNKEKKRRKKKKKKAPAKPKLQETKVSSQSI